MVSEKRLIDADAFLEKMKRTSRYFDVVFDVEEMPTVDAVEVTRCRNCIGRSTWYNDAEYGCAVCGMSGMYPKSEDSYCSYGIRKDGDRNG